MARPATERLVQHQIQTRVPRLPQRRRRALTRRVMGARLAGSANGPAPAPAPPGSPVPLPWQTPGRPGSLRRPITPPTHPRRAPLVLGRDASQRRADVVLLRMSVLYRGAVTIIIISTPTLHLSVWLPDALHA